MWEISDENTAIGAWHGTGRHRCPRRRPRPRLRIVLTRNEAFGSNLCSVIVIAPIGLTLQAAFFRIVKSRGRGLAFWTGFLACGTASMISLLAALYDPH